MTEVCRNHKSYLEQPNPLPYLFQAEKNKHCPIRDKFRLSDLAVFRLLLANDSFTHVKKRIDDFNSKGVIKYS
ncbi:hypothetical protein N7528_003357 [Penicillium herquei]|nr:hypothetical protein N7528_003357 [Penicillium herquei]